MDANLKKGIKEYEVCDSCGCLKFEADPDPENWFRDGDKKAVCTEVKATIVGSLERPSEMIDIQRPIWCPKSQKNFTEDQKKLVDEQLAFDKKRYKK